MTKAKKVIKNLSEREAKTALLEAVNIMAKTLKCYKCPNAYITCDTSRKMCKRHILDEMLNKSKEFTDVAL